MIPANQSAREPRPNYNQSFFVTPASDYKQLRNPNQGVLSFANSKGNIYNLKDYDYAVVQPAVGNPAVVLYVNDPDVFVERNDTWFLTKYVSFYI
jgi:peptidoglycan hydrolase-like amidase